MYTTTQIKEIIIKLLTHPVKTLNEYCRYHYLWIVQLSHSSTGEDVILDWIMKKKHWFYIDIWWYDPMYWNNTYLFYKKWWQWISIEPNKIGIKKFIKKRPRDINLQLAAWSTNNELTFYVFDDPTISTCNSETVQRYIDAWYKVVDTYTVPIWTLEKICDTYVKDKQIDILSVDVEWWDMNVLESNNWEKYRPTYIILETVEYAKNGVNTWTKQNDIFDPYLKSKGYWVIAETGINTIYKLQS